MFNLTRQIICTGCGGVNFWKGDPEPTDRLHCRCCDAFVATYDDYIYDLVRNEAARMMAVLGEPGSRKEFMRLKAALSDQGEQATEALR